MRLLAPIAAVFGIEADALTERLKRSAIFSGLIALFVAIALIFALLAIYVALSDPFGPLLAALIMAGGALAIALLIYGISHLGAGERRRTELERRRKSEANALITTTAITAIPALIRSPLGKGLGLPLIGLAAYLYLRGSRKPEDME